MMMVSFTPPHKNFSVDKATQPTTFPLSNMRYTRIRTFKWLLFRAIAEIQTTPRECVCRCTVSLLEECETSDEKVWEYWIKGAQIANYSTPSGKYVEQDEEDGIVQHVSVLIIPAEPPLHLLRGKIKVKLNWSDILNFQENFEISGKVLYLIVGWVV